MQAVDNLCGRGVIREEIVGQIGDGQYQPQHFSAVPFMDRVLFGKRADEASAFIGHAGVGTVMMALDRRKGLLAMPRQRKLHEHVNNHQLEFARRFAMEGHILLAESEEELAEQIDELAHFIPMPRIANPESISLRIGEYLNGVRATRPRTSPIRQSLGSVLTRITEAVLRPKRPTSHD